MPFSIASRRGDALSAEAVFLKIEAYVSPKGLRQTPTPQDVYHALTHMANNDPGVSLHPGATPAEDTFSAKRI